MGKLEEESRRVARRTKVQEAILLTLASGGRLGSELIVGQVFESLLGIDYPFPKRRDDIVRSAASRLRRKGLVKFEDGHYSLAVSGKKLLDRWQRTDFKLVKPKKWDKKWRIIIFDIPERKKRVRDEIRNILTNAGFERLQDSVWVYPYDCEDIIGLLKTDYGVGLEMLYIIADQIENDKYLRMDFDLL